MCLILIHAFVLVVTMAKLATAPPKFTHPEWNISNQIKYANAEAERSAAERLIAESKRLDEETAATTFKTQRDVNKKFRAYASIAFNLLYL